MLKYIKSNVLKEGYIFNYVTYENLYLFQVQPIKKEYLCLEIR